jgi:hypothetical protein
MRMTNPVIGHHFCPEDGGCCGTDLTHQMTQKYDNNNSRIFSDQLSETASNIRLPLLAAREFNLLKPSGYYMYHLFILPTECICVFPIQGIAKIMETLRYCGIEIVCVGCIGRTSVDNIFPFVYTV